MSGHIAHDPEHPCDECDPNAPHGANTDDEMDAAGADD